MFAIGLKLAKCVKGAKLCSHYCSVKLNNLCKNKVSHGALAVFKKSSLATCLSMH